VSKKKQVRNQVSSPKFPLWLIGVAALVVVIGVIAFVMLQSAPASVSAKAMPNEISLKDAVAKRDAGAFILDVREPDEWTDFHVPGSTLIPLGSLASRVNEVPRDKEIVVVCRSGNRSTSGRDILKKAGFAQVTSLAGGLNNWKAANYPTVSGQ